MIWLPSGDQAGSWPTASPMRRGSPPCTGQSHSGISSSRRVNRPIRNCEWSGERAKSRVFSKGAGIFSALPPSTEVCIRFQWPPSCSRKKNPRAIGHDPAPFIDSSGVGNARHALHAGTGVGAHDEKEKPRTKGNRAGKKTEIDPPRRAPRHFPFPVKLGSPLRREFRIEAHADFDGLFRTLRRNTCPGRNGVG